MGTYYIPEYHWYTTAAFDGVCYLTYLNVAFKSVKTAKELDKKDWEPFDEVMYFADAECSTCKIPKPPRSKHCTVCKTCIADFDHHCIWVNGCITKSNYTAFGIFVGTHAAFVVYHAVLFFLAVGGKTREFIPSLDF